MSEKILQGSGTEEERLEIEPNFSSARTTSRKAFGPHHLRGGRVNYGSEFAKPLCFNSRRMSTPTSQAYILKKILWVWRRVHFFDIL